MAKPSIIIIPGSFSGPDVYYQVVDPLVEKGYDIRAIHLPSVGPRDEVPPSMYADAAAIAKEVEKLADEGKDVILLPHSYGGVPTTESTKGLSKEERQKQGKKGGLIRLAYMTCLVPAVGEPARAVLQDMRRDEELQLQMKLDERGWMYHEPLSVVAKIAFSDLPSQEEAEKWAKMFRRHSATSFGDPLTHAGYKDVPVSYLVCEQDVCIPPKYQRGGIELIEKESGRKVDVTSIDVAHCPIVSAPQKVIDWIVDVVEKS